LPSCQYKYQSTRPPYIRFECDEESGIYGKFCIFHDKDPYNEHEHEVANGFKDKVSKSISENKALLCIGYFLPYIDFAMYLKGKSFPQPLYSNEATFYATANFRKAKISKEPAESCKCLSCVRI